MVANLLFADADDLLVVAIDSRRLEAKLRVDPERPGGFAWPHLHGPLNLAAVVRVLPYPRRPNGRYPRLPTELRRLDGAALVGWLRGRGSTGRRFETGRRPRLRRAYPVPSQWLTGCSWTVRA
jgi:hypothetical protein